MSESPMRILCVDDHRVVLEGIESMIRRQNDMKVAATASTGEEAVRLHREHQPDVTIMDLQLPVMSGLEAIRAIRSESPDARIVVLTMYQGDEDIFRALSAGAATYVLKDSLAEDLLRIVREVFAGQRPLPPNVAKLLAERHSQELTHREVEVLQLAARGMRNKEIGWALGITERTTQVHLRNVFAKLEVNDRTAAVHIALQRGILHLR